LDHHLGGSQRTWSAASRAVGSSARQLLSDARLLCFSSLAEKFSKSLDGLEVTKGILAGLALLAGHPGKAED